MAPLTKPSLGKLSAIASLAVGLCFSSPLLAGSVSDGTAPSPQKGVNIASGPKAPETDEPIARLQMASDLLAFGRDSKDPLVLIVAARIIKALGGTEVDLAPEGRPAGRAVKKPAKPFWPDPSLPELRYLPK